MLKLMFMVAETLDHTYWWGPLAFFFYHDGNVIELISDLFFYTIFIISFTGLVKLIEVKKDRKQALKKIDEIQKELSCEEKPIPEQIDMGIQTRRTLLGTQIEKAREGVYKRIVSMEEHGQDMMDVTKMQYLQFKELYKCYDYLLANIPYDDDALKTHEWLFNRGKLRTEAELHKRLQEQYQKRYEKEVLPIKRLKLLTKREYRQKIQLNLFWFLSPLPSYSIIGWIATDTDILYRWPRMMSVFLYPVSLLISYFIVYILGSYYTAEEYKEEEEIYSKAGKEAPFPTELAITAASVAMFVHSITKDHK